MKHGPRSLALLALLVACDRTQRAPTSAPSASVSDASPPPSPAAAGPVPTMPADEMTRLGDGSNAFAFDLWKRLQKKPENLTFSPASISAAIAMTYGGAKGETAAQMRKAMHFEGEPAPLMTSWGKLQGVLADPARPLKLRIANRLFGDKTVAFEAPYLEQTRTAFNAPLEPTDFKNAPEPSRKRINAWVEEQTEHRIVDLLPQDAIKPVTRLVLVNAIYFLAKWEAPFDSSYTKRAPFSTSATTKIDVETMVQTEGYGVVRADGVTAIELPYEGRSASMLLVVPDRVDGLAAVEGSLTAATLSGWVKKLAGERIELHLPRFEVAPPESLALGDELKGLGMPLAFDRVKADFTGIANPADPKNRLHVSEVFHKAFVKVNEGGTEAAAATAVVMATGGGAPAKAAEVKVDRPFLFFIRDKASGLVLFMGRVAKP